MEIYTNRNACRERHLNLADLTVESRDSLLFVQPLASWFRVKRSERTVQPHKTPAMQTFTCFASACGGTEGREGAVLDGAECVCDSSAGCSVRASSRAACRGYGQT